MAQGRLLRLPALLGTLAAAVLMGCAAAFLAVSKTAEAAFPGKNGRIAYVDGGVIYTINPDGSGKSKVTDTHSGGYPIDYSPDGKKIAAWAEKGYYIYTISVHGGGKSKVVEGDDPSYSSDGERIAYTGRRFFERDPEIYTINVNGSHRTKVTDNNSIDYWPSYSPDGKRIAYIRGRGRNAHIYTKNVGGAGKSNKVTGTKYIESNSSWGSRP